MFSYPLMELLCKELNQRTADTRVVHCMPNDLRRFYLLLEGKDRQEALFFCFTPPFLRFHLTSLASVPRPSSFHPLNAYLQNGILKESVLLQEDRILQLRFQTPQGEYFLIGEFFPRHPNYHLIEPDGTLRFSMHPLERTHYQLPQKQPKPAFKPLIWSSHREVEQAYRTLEKELEFDREKKALLAEAAQEAKKLKKKEREIVENLNQCSRWGDLQHEGELLKSQFSSIKKGTASISVHDWLTDQQIVLTLDPLKTPQEEMAARFRKAKKLQMGIAPLTKFLKRVQEDLQRVKQKEEQIAQAASIIELSILKSKTSGKPSKQIDKETAKAASAIYKEFVSSSGLKIWVGKNAKANDRLTFQLANGRDWWLHITGCPGSHVVIRTGKEEEPDPETIKDAMQLALYFSKARASGEGEVCITQRKYVSKIGGGKAGQVQISRHKNRQVRLDLDRIRALQGST